MNQRMPCHITDMGEEEDDRFNGGQYPDGLSEPESDEREDRHMESHEEFTAAMDAVKLSQHDMAMLTGKHRRTVWRWRTGRTTVPAYAWTIVRDRRKLRELTLELCK
jgi:hypothetical protein